MTASQHRLLATSPIARVRPEYVAAVRYPDGKRDLFHIRNADSLADARESSKSATSVAWSSRSATEPSQQMRGSCSPLNQSTMRRPPKAVVI
jgi:hypothetical protein